MSLFLKKVRKKEQQDTLALSLPSAQNQSYLWDVLESIQQSLKMWSQMETGEEYDEREVCVSASKLSFPLLIWKGKETFSMWRLSSNILEDKYLLEQLHVFCTAHLYRIWTSVWRMPRYRYYLSSHEEELIASDRIGCPKDWLGFWSLPLHMKL